MLFIKSPYQRSIYFFAIIFLLTASNLSYAQQIEQSCDLQQDSLALIALYNSTNGDNWTNNTGWLSSDSLSTWEGVTVNDGRVVNLSLASRNLTGIIPSEIGNLSELTFLHFGNNKLTGSLPPELSNLTKLTCCAIRII